MRRLPGLFHDFLPAGMLPALFDDFRRKKSLSLGERIRRAAFPGPGYRATG